MITFNEIIGYESIKEELKSIANMLKDGNELSNQGITLIKGMMLYGEPGVGKTMMANALINECNRNTFICRKDESEDDLIKKIKNTFKEASENVPSIVFLDDFDKFAKNEAKGVTYDAYSTVQACIDETEDKDIFVLATANTIRYFPMSLLRVGRFDKVIEIENPNFEDSINIIKYYLNKKKFKVNIDVEYMAKVMKGRSCAHIEYMVNDIALLASYDNSSVLTLDYFIKAFIRAYYQVLNTDSQHNYKNDEEYNDAKIRAYHEAGHVVVSEILNPNDVLLASIYKKGRSGGFTFYGNEGMLDAIKLIECEIIRTLGGKGAVELKFGILDVGSTKDISTSYSLINEMLGVHTKYGFSFYDNDRYSIKETKSENIIEMERFYQKSKEIIFNNMEFLEKIANALLEKKVITSFDIKEIKSNCKINYVSI